MIGQYRSKKEKLNNKPENHVQSMTLQKITNGDFFWETRKKKYLV